MREINKIIIHHSASPRDTTTAKMVNKWHMDQGWDSVGYHFMIDKDGRLFKGRPVKTIGAHCKGHNKDSVGVCVFGNFTKEEPTSEQEKSLLITVENLLRDLNLDHSRVAPHSELKATECPGNALREIIEYWWRPEGWQGEL